MRIQTFVALAVVSGALLSCGSGATRDLPDYALVYGIRHASIVVVKGNGSERSLERIAETAIQDGPITHDGDGPLGDHVRILDKPSAAILDSTTGHVYAIVDRDIPENQGAGGWPSPGKREDVIRLTPDPTMPDGYRQVVVYSANDRLGNLRLLNGCSELAFTKGRHTVVIVDCSTLNVRELDCGFLTPDEIESGLPRLAAGVKESTLLLGMESPTGISVYECEYGPNQNSLSGKFVLTGFDDSASRQIVNALWWVHPSGRLSDPDSVTPDGRYLIGTGQREGLFAVFYTTLYDRTTGLEMRDETLGRAIYAE